MKRVEGKVAPLASRRISLHGLAMGERSDHQAGVGELCCIGFQHRCSSIDASVFPFGSAQPTRFVSAVPSYHFVCVKHSRCTSLG